MAFMMPVVKNDWDIYNSGKSRRTSESAERGGGGGGPGSGRVRKVSESRSEGPGSTPRSTLALSPHRSAPAMRSLSYSRPPPASRTSLRVPIDNHSPKGTGSPPGRQHLTDKFHNRARAESPERSRCGACMPYL